MQHNTQVPVGKHNNRQHASLHHEAATDVKQMPIRPIIILSALEFKKVEIFILLPTHLHPIRWIHFQFSSMGSRGFIALLKRLKYCNWQWKQLGQCRCRMKTGRELNRGIVEDNLNHEVVRLLTDIMLTEKLDIFSVAINEYVPPLWIEQDHST